MGNHIKTLRCPNCDTSPLPWFQKNIGDGCILVRVYCLNNCAGIEIGMTFPDLLNNDEVNLRVLENWNSFVTEWKAPAVPHDNEGFDGG